MVAMDPNYHVLALKNKNKSTVLLPVVPQKAKGLRNKSDVKINARCVKLRGKNFKARLRL